MLPVWPCPGMSLDGATVSPDPSCLSLQYLFCWGARVSPVLSGVLCEFKYALSDSLFLSEDLSPRTMLQDYLA